MHMNLDDEIEDLLQSVAKMRLSCGHLKSKLSKVEMKEFVLTLECAEFYLYNEELKEATKELNKAISMLSK